MNETHPSHTLTVMNRHYLEFLEDFQENIAETSLFFTFRPLISKKELFNIWKYTSMPVFRTTLKQVRLELEVNRARKCVCIVRFTNIVRYVIQSVVK